MEEITISMEEYKELLIIKGKYEELKSQVWKFKIKQSESYIARLEQNLSKDFSEKSYEKMKRRDKCLLEEIGSFIDVI